MGWRSSLPDLTRHRKVDNICGFGTAWAQSATMARLWRPGCSFPRHWDEATTNEVKLLANYSIKPRAKTERTFTYYVVTQVSSFGLNSGPLNRMYTLITNKRCAAIRHSEDSMDPGRNSEDILETMTNLDHTKLVLRWSTMHWNNYAVQQYSNGSLI